MSGSVGKDVDDMLRAGRVVLFLYVSFHDKKGRHVVKVLVAVLVEKFCIRKSYIELDSLLDQWHATREAIRKLDILEHASRDKPYLPCVILHPLKAHLIWNLHMKEDIAIGYVEVRIIDVEDVSASIELKKLVGYRALVKYLACTICVPNKTGDFEL
jgi:hypothetical protein